MVFKIFIVENVPFSVAVNEKPEVNTVICVMFRGSTRLQIFTFVFQSLAFSRIVAGFYIETDLFICFRVNLA